MIRRGVDETQSGLYQGRVELEGVLDEYWDLLRVIFIVKKWIAFEGAGNLVVGPEKHLSESTE